MKFQGEELRAFKQSIKVEVLGNQHQKLIGTFKGHDRIQAFLQKEAYPAQAKGYSVTRLLIREGEVLGMISLAMTEVKMDPDEKQALKLGEWRKWPAVLIGMLGANYNYLGNRLGDDLIDLAKGEADIVRESIACRFLVADVYQEKHATEMYDRTGFFRCKHEQHAKQREPRYWYDLHTNPTTRELDG